jgi:O-antigen ligase
MSTPGLPTAPGTGGLSPDPRRLRHPDPPPLGVTQPLPSFVGIEEPDPTIIGRHRNTIFLILLGVLAIAGALAASYLQYDLGQAPHRVLKVMLGAAAALVILARPDWALGLLPLAFVYTAWLPKSPVPMLNTMNLLIGSIFLGWASHDIAQRRAIRDPSPWSLPLLLFLAWYGFAWLRSMLLFGNGLRSLVDFAPVLWTAVCGLILFLPVYNSLRTWKQIRSLTLLFCVGSGLGLLGIIKEGAHGGWDRGVGGGLGQVNVAAAYFATATVFGLGLLGAGFRGTWKRLLLLASIAASAWALLFSASRGAYLGFLVGSLPQIFRAGVIWVVVLGLLVGAFLLWAPDYAMERVTRAEEAATDETDRVGAVNRETGGRLDLWRASLDVIVKNPLIGVGYGRLPLEIERRTGSVKPAHNLYLETAGETGIPGLILLLWLFAAGLVGAAGLLRVPGFPRALGLAYQSAIVVLMVTNLFGGRFYSFNMAGMVSFLTALVFRARALVLAGVSEADEAREEHLNEPATSVTMAGGR